MPTATYAVPPALAPVTDTLRRLIDAELPAATGTIWHGHPVWKVGSTPVVGFKAYSSYVTLMFWRGAELADPSGTLRPSGPAGMTSAKLTAVDEELITGWLRQTARMTY